MHPGGIKTNIARNARMHVDDDTGADLERGKRDLERAFITTPEKAAAQILRAVQRDAPRALIGPDAHLFNALSRLPASVAQALIARGARRAL